MFVMVLFDGGLFSRGYVQIKLGDEDALSSSKKTNASITWLRSRIAVANTSEKLRISLFKSVYAV